MQYTVKQQEAIRWSRLEQRILMLLGSVRSGKTTAVAASANRHMLGYKRQNFAIVGASVGAVHRNILPVLEEVCRSHRISYKPKLSKGYVKIGHNLWYIFGCNDIRSERLLRGITLAGGWLDELSELLESYFWQLLMRCSVPGAKIYCTSNLTNPYHWLKQSIVDRIVAGELAGEVQYSKLADNTFLSQDTIDFYESAFTGVYKARFIDAEWVAAEGLVYPEPQTLDTDVPAAAIAWSIDYGMQNPTAALELAFTGQYWYVRREYYYTGGQRMPHEHLQHFGFDRPQQVIIDPSAAELRMALQRQGLPVVNAINDLSSGIQSLQTALANGQLRVHGRCVNLLRELANLTWQTRSDGLEKPVKEHDHAADALRYFARSTFSIGYGLPAMAMPAGL